MESTPMHRCSYKINILCLIQSSQIFHMVFWEMFLKENLVRYTFKWPKKWDFRTSIKETFLSESQRMKPSMLNIKHAWEPSLPSSSATTPFLLTTLQLDCLKAACFRGLACTNHRYALLHSPAWSFKNQPLLFKPHLLLKIARSQLLLSRWV